MAGGRFDSSLTRVQPFFTRLVESDSTGSSWLAPLLAATPHAEALGPTLSDPGTLDPAIAAAGPSGRLGCFEYPVPPSRVLLRWFVDHPDKLIWPAGQSFSTETAHLRRALVQDEPPGSRAVAQAAAREAVDERSPSARGWWRFEGTSMIDCVLLTEKLVITVEGKRTEPLSSTTHWYPKRSQLVRNLEAARQLAKGRFWASMLVSEEPVPEGTREQLDAVLPQSAPHLDSGARDELLTHYLGNITWQQACDATGVAFADLPDTMDDL